MVHNAYRHLGGEDLSTEAEVSLLRESGHEVELMIVSSKEIESASRIKKLRFAHQSLWNYQAARVVSHKVKQNRVDIVHLQNFYPIISPSVLSAARSAGAATVVHLRNYRLLCFNHFMRDGQICEACLGKQPWRGVRHRCRNESLAQSALLFAHVAFHRFRKTWEKDVDLFITPTRFAKQKFIEAGWDGAQIAVKPNFLNSDPGSGKTGGRHYALFVGRLDHTKGVETLLKACCLVRDVPVRIIGDGPLAEKFRSFVAHNGLDQVTFLGELPHTSVIEAMRGARFLIMPSEWYETFGRTIMEAFACGTPVVASRLGAMQELVEDGVSGWHFEPGNPEDLAKILRRAWNNPEECSRSGGAARLQYLGRFTSDANSTCLIGLYQRAAAMKAKSIEARSKLNG
jgi:glycosyltransferase involved in cell wall biosynthesis